MRELDGERHTPVMMAVSGPRARDLAAAKADIVTPAVGPLVSRAEVVGMIAELRAAAGDRADSIELANNVFAVGDRVPPWMEEFLGADAATMRERDSLSMLHGTPAQIADELRRRRGTLGMSYVMVNAAFLEELAPVVEMLTGH